MFFARLKQVAVVTALASAAYAAPRNPTNVPSANPKVPGFAAPNILSPELTESLISQGPYKLENPSDLTSNYGYDNDGPMLPAPGDVPAAGHKVEATKTEPDKNTYLILDFQTGADHNYDYGTHFLFQGHEVGLNGNGYITRVNLDADGPHRVTLLADKDVNGHPLPIIDGSTWYPFSRRLLFTVENGANGGVLQATLDVPSAVEDISGIFGRGGYEGIQADNRGRLVIVEDVGGSTGSAFSHAKRPNSFIYRFLPYDVTDLKQGGRLQVLSVMSRRHSGPITFVSDPDASIKSPDMQDLHTFGMFFETQWLTIHDTRTDGFVPFDANALAKAAGGTPFKRPENGQFRPGSNFSEFVFDETGDTDALTEAGSAYGGFGSSFHLRLNGNRGILTLFYLGDVQHTGFDNVAFWDEDRVVFVEDAGDGLHTQRNALDSAYLFDLNADYSNPANQPIRLLAEGRDASATLDSQLGSFPGFQNEGDNEITGWHTSDGDPTIWGLLGTKIPRPFKAGWRTFYTQQHGDNNTWEILQANPSESPRDRE
jgi:hypothetical protein